MTHAPLYKALADGRYVCFDPAAGGYRVVGAESVPPLVALPGKVQRAIRLSQPAAPPSPAAPKGDGRKARALLLMAMVEFQRRAHRVGMPDAAQPYLDHLAKLAADPKAARQAIRLSLAAGPPPAPFAFGAPRRDPAPYGYCPECRDPATHADRRPDGNAGCANGHTFPRKRAKFSYVGVPLAGEAAARLLALGAQVRGEDLADDGREAEPHVTVRYGLHTADAAGVAPLLANAGPVKLWLGKVSVFRGAETGAPFDVLKVDVDSPDLRRLNAALAALPHTDTHPEYKPHATIAYVKAGLGDGYAARLGSLDVEAEAPEAEFSTPARERTAVRLSFQAVPLTRPSPNSQYQFKAVGDGPDAGRVYYGADAQRAIDRQQQRGTEAQEYDRQAQPVTGKEPAAGDHPEAGYSHKDFQAKQKAAYKAASKVASLAVSREDVTADHLKEMAGHLPYLTVSQLRSVRARLNTAFDVSFGGKSRRAEMVGSVMSHVRAELDRLDKAAGAPVVDAPGRESLDAGVPEEEAAGAAAPAAPEPVAPEPEPAPAPKPPTPKANDYRAALAGDDGPAAAPAAPAGSLADAVKAGDWAAVAARVKTGKDKDELVAAVRQHHGEDAAKGLLRMPPAKAAQWASENLRGKADAPAADEPAPKPAMSKAEAKAMVAALPVPASLPDNPADYFLVNEADAHVPLDKIKNLRQRPEGVENAAKFMEASRRGLMPKRSPLKVVDNGDGTAQRETLPESHPGIDAAQEAAADHLASRPADVATAEKGWQAPPESEEARARKIGMTVEQFRAAGRPANAAAPKHPNPHVALADTLAAKLTAGETLTAKDVFALADEHHGGTRAEGKYGPSDAYDSLETAFNKSVAGKTDPTADLAGAQAQARDLAERVAKLPTQTNRSGNKDAFQQFSTPPHYAFAANWVANLRPTDTVLEPSAGTGSLAIHAKNAGATVVTNELDPRRAAFLKDQFGAGAVHGENGEQIGATLHGKVRPSVVVMNPPFSQTAGRMGDKKDLHAGAKHIEQGLQLLPDGGRCVAIVGRGMTPESPTYRKWFAGLAKAGYTLSANVGVSGGEYKKYGTSFDTRLLVIDKVPPADGHAPVTGDAEDVPDLMAKLEGVRNARPGHAEPAPVGGAGAGVPEAAGGVGGPDAAGAAAAAGGVPAAGRPGRAARGGAGGVEGGGLPAGAAAAGGGGVDAGAGPGGVGGAGGGGPRAGGAGAAGTAGVAGDQPAGVQDRPGGGKGARGKPLRKPSVSLPVLRPAAQLVVEPVAAPAAGAAGTSNAELGDSLYETYRPARVRIPGAKPHASPLVESAAMSAVQPPAATYRPHLSPDLIDQGKTVTVTNPDGSVQTISVGLSEAGVESVVYAGQAHQKYLQAAEAAEGAPAAPAYRRGYFIGDGTGAGKGRQVAGIMTDNWNQGRKKHVWVTQKQSLYNDAQRDWRDVGNDPAQVVHFDDIRKSKTPPAEGVAFITYDTLKSKPTDPAAPTNLDALVNWVGKDFDGVLAFDEAHTMANALDTEGGRGMKTASERALAGVKLQQMLPHARVVYVSATGATELSNLAYAERLGLWGRGTPFATKQDFIGQMEKGGVAAMEAVAQSLKATGGYAARSLAFDDGTPTGRVEYDRLTHSLSPEQHGTYDHLAEAWQKVLQNIGAALEVTGADKNGHAKAAAKSQFWGAQQRFFNQVMTSMQLPSVIKGMEADIAAGKAPVVQLVNTMEAATKRALARSEDGDLDNIDVSPKEVLMQYLQKSFPVHRFEKYTDENNNVKTRLVMGADGKPAVDPAAVRIREEMLDMVGALAIPESPIDQLLRHFGHEHVAEATGRSQRFVWARDPETGEMKKTLERRGATANTAEARAFQSGQKKVMIFSDAGGTGSSYHADRNAKNQKQRVHYVLQPGWRADNAVQGLGRTHRTNQAVAPIFRLVEIDQLKAQKRFISTIARRLDQLGALTRGQRQAGSSGLFKAADNLESKEAREAMETFFRDLSRGRLEGLDEKDVLTQLGFWEEPSEEDKRKGKAKEPKTPESMGQFLNRLLSLKVATQGQVFGHYERILNDTVERAAAAGTLDTGVENFPADRVRAKAERTIHQDADSGAEAKLYTVAASQKVEKRPWKANLEGMAKPLYFVRNKQSGRVWAVHQASSRTDTTSGQVHPQYVLRGPTAKQFRDQSELYHAEHGYAGHGPAANWEKIDTDTARALWEQEHDATPDHKETDEHFVTGAFLPIWDKIPDGGRPRIFRVRTDDGRTVVGRHVPADQVEGLMRNLGLGYEGKKHTPEETHAAVARGDATARLSNGWTLHPAMVGGQRRIEVKGISPFALNEAVSDGVIKERVGGYDTRLFIPTGPDGLKVLERVLKSRNATIAGVTNKRESERMAPAPTAAHSPPPPASPPPPPAAPPAHPDGSADDPFGTGKDPYHRHLYKQIKEVSPAEHAGALAHGAREAVLYRGKMRQLEFPDEASLNRYIEAEGRGDFKVSDGMPFRGRKLRGDGKPRTWNEPGKGMRSVGEEVDRPDGPHLIVDATNRSFGEQGAAEAGLKHGPGTYTLYTTVPVHPR